MLGRWWPALWVLTSVVLIAAAAQVRDAIYVAVVYVVFNAIGMATLWLRDPRPSPTILRRLGIAAAFQAPVAVIALFYPDARPSQDEAGTDTAEGMMSEVPDDPSN